jgi:predicted DNA-binding transcriptional regulator AlpA
MSAVDVAEYLAITVPGLYLAVRAGRLPRPLYPLSRSPRWKRSDVDTFLEKTRTTPTQARADRRQARLDKQKAITAETRT